MCYLYWSSSPFTTNSAGIDWVVNFADGSVYYAPYVNEFYTLCVHPTNLNTANPTSVDFTKFSHCGSLVFDDQIGPSGPYGPYIDNGDGTVTDQGTNVMWQQYDDGKKYSWEDACCYCENLNLAGYNDWMLPEISQLYSLVDGEFTPEINDVFF